MCFWEYRIYEENLQKQKKKDKICLLTEAMEVFNLQCILL